MVEVHTGAIATQVVDLQPLGHLPELLFPENAMEVVILPVAPLAGVPLPLVDSLLNALDHVLCLGGRCRV
jgi:hypothetical protein